MLSESQGQGASSGQHQSPREGGKINGNNKKGSPNGRSRGNIYRADGVRITHDPYAPGVAERYGLPGKTDSEGFDPYADTVGPGIYGGSVKRDENGDVIIGKQYQNHNRAPGPVYDDKGYSLMSRAIHAGPSKVSQLISTYPQLAHEISTGGATPLHVCGMSQTGQQSTQTLIDAGAEVNAVDTYGYTALHRMCSNNLVEGAEVLLKAGADPNGRVKGGESPLDVARSSRASKVLVLLRRLGY